MNRAEFSPLALRVMSAAVMAPVPIAAIWFGEPWLGLLAVLAAGVMAWEWSRICQGRRAWTGETLVGIVAAAVLIGGSRGVLDGIGVAVTGAVFMYVLAAKRWEPEPLWLAFGVVWIAVPCVLLLWLARPEAAGRATVL